MPPITGKGGSGTWKKPTSKPKPKGKPGKKGKGKRGKKGKGKPGKKGKGGNGPWKTGNPRPTMVDGTAYGK